MKSENELIRVVIVKPGQEPYTDYIKNTLDTVQEIVEGYIEFIPNQDKTTLLIFNEDGKLKGLPVNRVDDVLGSIVGNFLVVGNGDEDFCSLTEMQCKEYEEKYRLPVR